MMLVHALSGSHLFWEFVRDTHEFTFIHRRQSKLDNQKTAAQLALEQPFQVSEAVLASVAYCCFLFSSTLTFLIADGSFILYGWRQHGNAEPVEQYPSCQS